MKLFLRFLIAFLAITGAVALLSTQTGIQFGHADYWQYHGVLFLIAVATFPRLTLLFSGVASGGLLWWLGWLFAPRLLVALLATLVYWYENPVLVIISWLIALGGESSEKYVVVNRTQSRRNARRGYESAKWVDAQDQSKR